MTTNLRLPVPPCVAPDAPSPFAATGAPLRWGVVATGGIARKVTEDIACLEDAVLQAVSSRREDRARTFADTHGFVLFWAAAAAGESLAFSWAEPRLRQLDTDTRAAVIAAYEKAASASYPLRMHPRLSVDFERGVPMLLPERRRHTPPGPQEVGRQGWFRYSPPYAEKKVHWLMTLRSTSEVVSACGRFHVPPST